MCSNIGRERPSALPADWAESNSARELDMTKCPTLATGASGSPCVLAFCVSELRNMVCVLSRVLVLNFGLHSGDFCVDVSGGSCVPKLRFGVVLVQFSDIIFRFV